jgi:hypothetical protein
MKTLLLVTCHLSLVTFLPGCADLPACIAAAAKDHSQVHIEVITIYGRMVYDRDNPTPSVERARHSQQ